MNLVGLRSLSRRLHALAWGSRQGATRWDTRQLVCTVNFALNSHLIKEPRNQGAEPRTTALSAQALAPDKVGFVNFALFATWWHCINRNGEDFFSSSMDLAVETLVCLGKAGIQAGKGCTCFSASGLSIRSKAFTPFQPVLIKFPQTFSFKVPSEGGSCVMNLSMLWR